MKKLLMSKKALAASALALMLAMGGMTYAWFTTSSAAQGSKVQVGTLGIVAEFDAIDDEIYEPGTYASVTGTVKSTGSIAVIAKASNEGGKIFKDGNLWKYITDDENEAVYYELDESKIGYDLNKGVFWMKDKTTGELYLVLDQQTSVTGESIANVGLDIQFTGKMGNEYQGATVDYTSTWNGTQAREGAMLDVLGVDEANLVPVNKDLAAGSGFRSFSASLTDEQLMAIVQEIFNR